MLAMVFSKGQVIDSSRKTPAERFLGTPDGAEFRTVYVDNIVAKCEERAPSP
jgi:hypothetical protein